MLIFDRDVTMIPKNVVCDVCDSPIAVTEKEIDEKRLPTGYTLCDEEYYIQPACEVCRNKYFRDLECYSDLEEALI